MSPERKHPWRFPLEVFTFHDEFMDTLHKLNTHQLKWKKDHMLAVFISRFENSRSLWLVLLYAKDMKPLRLNSSTRSLNPMYLRKRKFWIGIHSNRHWNNYCVRWLIAMSEEIKIKDTWKQIEPDEKCQWIIFFSIKNQRQHFCLFNIQ